MSISGLVLGLINAAIVAVILLLVGAVILWGLGHIGVSVPAMVQKLYIALVVLIVILYVVSALFGLGPSWPVRPFR